MFQVFVVQVIEQALCFSIICTLAYIPSFPTLELSIIIIIIIIVLMFERYYDDEL